MGLPSVLRCALLLSHLRAMEGGQDTQELISGSRKHQEGPSPCISQGWALTGKCSPRCSGEAAEDTKLPSLSSFVAQGAGCGEEPAPFHGLNSISCSPCPQIQDSEHIKVENSEAGSKLTILAARQEHCGCYTLVVENKLGSRQAQVNLTVVGEYWTPLGAGNLGRGGQ